MPPPLPPPRKRFGQHFLIDPNIVRKIVTLSALGRDEPVLEIGPGRGILTKALCREVRRVIAVEIDPQLVTYLNQSLTDCRNLDLRLGDALTFPYETLPEGTVVVGNLPYNLSTPLLFALLESRARLSRMVLMLQAEVAQRLIAGPGSRDYGILSVLLQYWTIPSLGFRVAPTCFRPKPRVGSTVVTLLVRTEGAAPVADEGMFVRTVRAAFAHRRKILSNSLRQEGFPPNTVAVALAQAGIAPSRRAETLHLSEFAALANRLGSVAAGDR